jgi:S-DNA-T family DNA segregation ATPase FtsK/SpoIIIE
VTRQPITTKRQRELIARLTNLAARRATEGAAAGERHRARIAEARQRMAQAREQLISQFQQRHAALVAEFKAEREAILARYETQGFQLAQEEEQFTTKAAQDLAESLADAKALRQHRIKQVLKAYQEQKVVPKTEYAAFKLQCAASAGEVNALVAKAQAIVRRRCPWPEEETPGEPPVTGLTKQQYQDAFLAAMSRAAQLIGTLQNQPAARFIEDGWPILIFIAAVAVAAIASWLLTSSIGLTAVISLVTGLLAAIGAWQGARPYARRQTLLIVPQFQQAIAEARANLSAAVAAAKAAGEQAYRQIVERRDADLSAAKEDFKQERKDLRVKHRKATRKAEEDFSSRRKAIEDKYEQRLDKLEEKYPREIAAVEKGFLQQMDQLQENLRAATAQSKAQRESDLANLAAEWTAALAEFEEAAAAMNAHCDRHFAPWTATDWTKWQPPSSAVRSEVGNGQPAGDPTSNLSFGHFQFELSVPEDADDRSGNDRPLTYRLPAVLSYPECPSLLLEAEGDGRDAATNVLQNVMLRLLTTFPPSKVRFTIIDPVGLGQNFSAFMHLADYDEKLVNSRIWTEGAHINQRLADLTEHMENVIQKYLRNEFASIQEYNQHAGEVAEPFQILVIANFPANFSDEAARRLAAIVTSGARCGVYTLITTDAKIALPRNFELSDLEAQAATLVWDTAQRRFRWKYAELAELPLDLEVPPDGERFTEIVRTVGKLAKDAARVEVPFEMIAPQRDWWSSDSRSEVEVPLGRAGAKNLQYMRLGKGTSQHVLISGKTGSGKSTLLNALITALGMHYSPQELEFYLIDFKKGVEFKAYATHRLPHARVIAIESEREFGMSVLERLDQELKRRGDLFRQAGVQDVKGYRNALELAGAKPGPSGGREGEGARGRGGEDDRSPTLPLSHPPTQAALAMPRVLLIIDEFQEFFTSDDKISHDAALLLDRLVRQGRAFGIHVILGSQTLSGAYSLARSTLGQMAVRIALQCSEADAHLILSEDNTAARLLSRPGEAIYNDANGMFEGNHPFQIVWLSDSEREEYLRRIAELAVSRRVMTLPPIVFEGNAAADLSENQLLKKIIAAADDAPRLTGPTAWLGAAVAIKDPTEAVFRRQSGSNLLIVGQQDELALGILASSVISLAAQSQPGAEMRFTILDGTRPEAPEAGAWERLDTQLRLGAKVVLPRDAAAAVNEIGDEVDRRMAAPDQAGPPVVLVIHNLARFRDLKKGDDYSFDEEGAGAAKKLVTILREGPSVGVHTLVWCDSYNNANRWLDRQAMRDFEMRVLFQMSAADSSNLMDSPAASRLGGHTALFYSEERGQAEKFRPYGMPRDNWLNWVAGQLAVRPDIEPKV